ncbi:MAG: hypothetical protein CMD26_01600 [Flavobacteriales bacterium]|nr:hypothetical protein [Flavobacteriales bacterium]|tara:strand:+ start:3707 stop:4363 length:657 start_codon:yes stop_codon:yes gene_type:complete
MKTLILIVILILSNIGFSQNSYQLAVLKYKGGGDWYANPSSLKNLANFCNTHLNTNIQSDYAIIEADSPNLFDYPFIHMTGHGNVLFSQSEAENLRNYLTGGGFLHIDDNYGMNKYIRLEIKKIFPDLDFIEIPHNHYIYNNIYNFENGLPKIHEHDNNPPQGLALIYNGRIVCFYSYESDLGDGWEDSNVHNDPAHIRQEALKMGANIIAYAMNKKR